MENNRDNKPARFEKTGMKNFDLLFLIWSVIRPALIIIVCVLLIAGVAYAGTDFFLNRFWLPADPNDDTPIQVEIKRGTPVGGIANILEDYGLVRNADVFEYYIDFSGYGSKMKSGLYVFNKQMSMQEIMEKLAKGDGRSVVTTFTIIEGLTVEEMADSLMKQGLLAQKISF